jgi:outer membrane biosynthesis protein TonB
MSTLINSARAGARARVPRFAEAAVERARLTVVPPRRSLGRTQAARTPFAVLVIMMLAAGVVGLLMFNTNMQQASFKATALQDQVNVLTAKEQSLAMQLDQLRDPQQLAASAKHLGMVAPAQPAFVRLSDGRVLGTPTPASPAEAVRINPLPSQLPPAIKQKVVIVKVPAVKGAASKGPASKGTATTSTADTPGTSTTGTSAGGRKKANTTQSADTGATH